MSFNLSAVGGTASLVAELTSLFWTTYPPSTRAPKSHVVSSHEHCLEQLVLNLVSVANEELASLEFVVRTRFYADQRHYLGPLVTSSSVQHAVAFLHDHNLVSVATGYASVDSSKRRASSIRPTMEFVKLCQKHDVCTFEVKPKPTLPLRLRMTKEATSQEDEHESGLVEFHESEETERMTGNLGLINEFLATTTVALDMTPAQWADMEWRLIGKAKRQKRRPKRIRWLISPLYRVFNNSRWDHGGRFYGPDYQGIPKEYRQFLMIDGQPTVEVDFTAMHPTMLYARLGVQLVGDPYRTPFCNDRDLVKVTLNALLNAKRRNIKPVDLFDSETAGMTWKQFVDRVLEHFRPLQRFICSGEGIKLQRIDSDIAEMVMLAFVRFGIPILPMHDSFLVPAQHEHLLIDTMKSAFLDKISFSCEVKVKRREGSTQSAQPEYRAA
ncbi:MAG: hypothetical protein EOP62_22565 [Sphingomonadales bacterium]|nr:MAG: hypothetical protein EOP62_22565 [Sphingomonadales bacterium]